MDYKKMYEEMKQENEKLQDNLNTIADTLDIDDYEENADIDIIMEVLGSKLDTLEEWETTFELQDAVQVECELNDRQEECDELQKKITSLKKALEYTKKNKVNEDEDDAFLPESQDVGGLDTDTV
jgi:Skp family chaperone for outer membrane proteins